MYNTEKIYRSVIYHMSLLVPSGVTVVEGESYGVRRDDPRGKQPSIAVVLEDTSEAAIELGSFGTSYMVVYTISAQSRMQRDALKDIVYSGLLYNPLSVYSDFTDYVPASGAIVEKGGEIQFPIIQQDMPNFDTDREKFFWVAVVFAHMQVLGV